MGKVGGVNDSPGGHGVLKNEESPAAGAPQNGTSPFRGARFPPAVERSLQRQRLQVLAQGVKQILDRAVIGP